MECGGINQTRGFAEKLEPLNSFFQEVVLWRTCLRAHFKKNKIVFLGDVDSFFFRPHGN